jgi:thioredoxin reductase (NADPH)
VALGDTWVHLRMRMTCALVGCCDSSTNLHGTRHAEDSAPGHHIIRSLEPGERWLWCSTDRTTVTYPASNTGGSRMTSAGTRPVIVVLDGDGPSLEVLRTTLTSRFGNDYDVACTDSPQPCLTLLDRLRGRGDQIALVVAAHRRHQPIDLEFLGEVRRLHPRAKRMVVVPFGKMARDILFQAMAMGHIDDYLVVPWGHPEEHLYPQVGALLSSWVNTTGERTSEVVRIVGHQDSPRSHELCDLVQRHNISYGFHADDSPAGRELLREARQDGTRLPVVLLWDGQVLVEPSMADIAVAVGAPTRAGPGRYDLTIVGAGPAGLAAAVYGASEGLRTVVLEREAPGGQAGTSSMIRNYLGFARGVSGRDLAQRAMEQAWLFGAEFVLNSVTGLRRAGPDRILTLADGSEVASRTVVLATGVAYRRLDVPGLDRLSGAGVFYGAAVAEAKAMMGLEVFVVGAGNSAGQAALYFAAHAARVTILARGAALASSMSDYLVKEIEAAGNIAVRCRTEVEAVHGEHRLEGLTLRRGADQASVTAQALFVMIGAKPHTDWLAGTVLRDDQGFVRTGRDLMPDGALPDGWPLDRAPTQMETSIPGVYAVGDVRHRSVKRVASAVGAGSIAVQLIHDYLREP